MNIHLAFNTLKAIHEKVEIDQGSKYRENLGKVMPHLSDAYRAEDGGFRSHLGASLIGKECDRALWYDFHWATKPKFSGQIIRLFNRGHLEEGRFIALLLTIGAQVYQQDANGNQFRISDHGGHFGGSGDGVVINLPDLQENQPALSEFKTHNNKSFSKLAGSNWPEYYKSILENNIGSVIFKGEGVKESKYEHWIQMQVYMLKMVLGVAIYVAVNKDNDHIYCELVPLDSMAANYAIERAGKVINSPVPLDMINKSVGWFGCTYCDHKPVCKMHKDPERNCRTCKHADIKTGEWNCTYHNILLNKEAQLKGCDNYDNFA